MKFQNPNSQCQIVIWTLDFVIDLTLEIGNLTLFKQIIPLQEILRYVQNDKKARLLASNLVYFLNLLPFFSSDTVNFFRPLARRRANTVRPFLVFILFLKP